MMFLQRGVAFILISCLIVHFVTAQSETQKSGTLFTINKRPVTIEEFTYLYRKNHQQKPEEFTKEKISDYLDLFINYKLKVEEALTRGMDTTATFRKEYETYRLELLKPYMPDSKVIDSLVLLTYNRLKEEVNASHILIRLDPDASPADTAIAFRRIVEIRDKALTGEDFGLLAGEFSEEPGAKETKGNLGFFTAMQMVFPFEQAAYLTPVGKISNPVRTQFGYHIVKVLDRQPSRGEVEVSHIMIRTQGADDMQARNTIFDIHDQLQKGVSWEELCNQYSQDPNSKDKGGRLRPFGVGAMASVPEFQEAAFSLKNTGDISDPVQTQFGWHILRLESKIPLPAFEELKPSLTQRVARDERVQISREALRERMRRQFDYQEQSNIKAELLNDADSLLKNQKLIDPTMRNKVLFTMKNQTFRVQDFLNFLNGRPELQHGGSAAIAVDDIFTSYVDHVQTQMLEEQVRQASPDYRWLLREYYEGILLFEIMEREVWNKATEDSTGQLAYFMNHSQKYQAGERMAGTVFSSSNRNHLIQLKRLLEAGDKAAQEFRTVNRIRQDSGIFQQKDRAVFSSIKWSPGTYEVELNSLYYLIIFDKLLPPGPQTFEEARASVISDYQSFLEDSWIRELKRKFVVKVNKKAKKRAFEELIGSNIKG